MSSMESRTMTPFFLDRAPYKPMQNNTAANAKYDVTADPMLLFLPFGDDDRTDKCDRQKDGHDFERYGIVVEKQLADLKRVVFAGIESPVGRKGSFLNGVEKDAE